MKIKQIYTGCLAQGAYYIENNGEVAIIDPLREVQPYIDMAESNGAKIKYIFETHFHADFVSGHVSLSQKTGAPIIYGPLANPSFDAIIAEDGQEFSLGDARIKVLHTPGHTMESSCYLLSNSEGKDIALFSGDTLFLGDVGRPDLAQKAAHMTQEELAGTLFDSLRNKIMPLSDDITVYPAHGAGSACGKNMMKETLDSLGNQKKMNYALRPDMTREEFIKEVTDGLLPPPAYFPMNVKMNKEGYQDLGAIMDRSKNALSPENFEHIANEAGALVLDVRNQEEFAQSHVPRSIFIGLNGSFAPWVGDLIKDVQQPLLLVVSEDKLEEAITRLSRVGFDNVLGYLEGGIDAWLKSGRHADSVRSIEPGALKKKLDDKKLQVIDVRRESEYLSEHMENAENFPLTNINDYLDRFEAEKEYNIHCAGGYRSMIAASILKMRGIHNIVDIKGGFDAMKSLDLPLTDYVCPSTL